MSPAHQSTRPGPPRLILALTVGVIGVVGILIGMVQGRAIDSDMATAAPVPSIDPTAFRFDRLSDSSRTVVTDREGVVVATFTDGARTVAVAGPLRTFAEPRFTLAAVRTATWVRLAPQPWTAGAEQDPWVRPWLASALTDTGPDVLAVAMEYLHNAPDAMDEDEIRYAGNASYGPQRSGGKRAEASDFYDYLGVAWQFSDGVREVPSDERYGAVDCSGYIRLVYGYRLGYPLLGGNTAGPGLPRRAFAMAVFGPGELVIQDHGTRPFDLEKLQAGDLLFFTTDDEPGLDHSAIYLGRDSDGLHRFISSRATPDGPTLGDMAGASVLDGGGYFAERFRAARRI